MKNRLRFILWGKDTGRARRYLVLSTIALALLGGIAVWAKPKIDHWLNPPEPQIAGTCSERAIFVGSTPLLADLVTAKTLIGRPNDKIINAGWVWDVQEKRLEFWLLFNDSIAELEFVCFEIVTPGQTYTAQFGEFRIINLTDAEKWDNDLKDLETGS
jgi:disulfide bond formation protein DsbB